MQELSSEQIIGLLRSKLDAYDALVRDMLEHIHYLQMDNDAMQSTIDSFFDRVDSDALQEFAEQHWDDIKPDRFVVIDSVSVN